MTYPKNEVLFQENEFKIKKFENRRFTVIEKGLLLGAYSTFGAAKLFISLLQNSRKPNQKKMGEKRNE